MDLVRLDGARGSRANVGCAGIVAEIETGTGGALLTGCICLVRVALTGTFGVGLFLFNEGGKGGGEVGLETLVVARLGCFCQIS